MPELPEVETIRQTLIPRLVGRTITGGEVLLPKLIQNQSVNEFLGEIHLQKISDIQRRGKYLLIILSVKTVLAIHLRMTGQLIVEPANITPAKATYLMIKLDDGNELRFRDQRKFGRIFLYDPVNPPHSLQKLGPEPLESEFSVTVLKKQLSGRQIGIKKALLDQETIAGIGNIYADEALFVAGINPTRPVNTLKVEEYEKLYQGIKQVLSEGIEFRGTTKRDYCDGDGKKGSYQDKLKVYGRKGLPCLRCQTIIQKINFGGRGTHFCPTCQK